MIPSHMTPPVLRERNRQRGTHASNQRHVADFDVELAPITETGDGRGGRRRIIQLSVAGSGPCFNGEIMNVGADWQTCSQAALRA